MNSIERLFFNPGMIYYLEGSELSLLYEFHYLILSYLQYFCYL